MKQKLLKFLWIMCGLGFAGILTVIITIAYFSFGLPKISSLADYKPPIPSQILSKDGTVLAEIGIQKRMVATLDEIPQVIIDAFLSAEDSGFYDHEGVDYMGIARAMVANLKAGRVVQGGSTITQQVAKSLLLTNERSIVRKIKDVLLARRIEDKFSKREILFLYLNQVYLGGGYYGVKEAFQGYFGKELSEATVAESAMIAGLLVAPGRYSPYIHPKFAKQRQTYVLGRMYANKKISEEQYKAALQEKIKYQLRKSNYFKAGYFTEWVRQRVVDLVGEDNFLMNGFKVVTTLDWDLQQNAEKQVSIGIREIDKRQGYKGPLGFLATPEEVFEYEKKFRTELYEEVSNFFILDENNEKQNEIVYDEQRHLKIRDNMEQWKKEIANRRFVPGFQEDDPLHEYLRVDESYKAVVEKVDGLGRIVYVNIGGVPGIISQSGYRWAHERVISEERPRTYPVVNPNTILKPGDVVLVKVLDKSVGLWRNVYSDFRTRYKSFSKLNEVMKQHYVYCELDQEPDVQGALFSINPHNGEIIAFVGGSDFRKNQFNRIVQSARQPGSSFKPIIYAAALENGFTPASIILDSPEALGGADAGLNWKPRNYDGKFIGPMTLRRALEKSRNIPAIKIASKVGVSTIHDFAARIGFEAKIDPDLSLSLGSFGVSLKDIVSSYAIFPNGGKIVDPKSVISIVDRDGNVYQLDENEKLNKIRLKENYGSTDEEAQKVDVSADIKGDDAPTTEEKKEDINPYQVALGGEQVYDPRLSYLMSNLLKGVVLHGTGRGAKSVSHFLGGKTGTTNNYVDAWFVGFSSNVATGVWTGFDDNKTLGWGETGGKSALPIWRDYMRATIQKFGEHDFKIPPGIVHVAIDQETGRLAKDSMSGFVEAFVEGTEPKEDSEQLIREDSEEDSKGGLFEEEDYYNVQ